ncbi:ankyrin repeat domain-containing protein [Mycena vulgaris]|nr:ankyrin repeat domain-containing protein [Mycena vulgaris]
MHYDVKTEYFTVNRLGVKQMNAAERKEIINWLSPINFFLRHADIKQVRVPGTGGWFLADPRFQEWHSGSGRILWCPGIPGAGKTVLASMVVDHLDAESKDKNFGVACAYLDHKEAEDQTPAKLLAGLWRQFVLGKDVGSSAKKLYNQHEEKGTYPTVNEVSNVLRAAIMDFSRVYIIIDAVDEYPETGREILLDYLTKMGPTVNLMIMSRPHITLDFSLPNPITLKIQADEHDVQRYVDAQIQISPHLREYVQSRDGLQEEIHSGVTRRVKGMFLLAKLHIESLSAKRTMKGVLEALKILPGTLNGSYDDAMKRIEKQNEDDRKIAHSTLTWVANAKRPLKAVELQTALAIEPDKKSLDKNNVLDIKFILPVCAGLVILDEQLSVVRLVHYTTQEYLDHIQPQQFPNAQTEITRSLLTFLAFDNIIASMRTHSNYLSPLVEYSQYCLAHAAGPAEDVLRDMILHFLAQMSFWGRDRWNPWEEGLLRDKWSSPPWGFYDWPSDPSLLWIAAAANLVKTAKFLLNETSILQLSDNQEIIVASYYGHLQMVQLLVDHGVNVNAQSGQCGALQAASYKGHKKIAQLLLECGANVNAQGGEYGSALQAASYEGHEELVQLLLEYDADVNVQVQGRIYGNILQTVSFNGHKEIVQLLIKYGADVNAQGGEYGSALQAASYKGHKEITQLLLRRGANVNAQGGHFGSALQAASYMVHKEITQLLLEHSANVNAQGGKYGSALQVASYEGHKELVELLLKHGADVNMEGRIYGNVLQTASCKGYKEIVQSLLEHGANVNARGGQYGSALQAASYKSHKEITQLLLKHGADVNAEGGEYNSALQSACSDGYIEIVQLLLEHGVNVHGRVYGDALQAASLKGDIEIVHLLLEHGANTNAQGEVFGSALRVASEFGHKTVVECLLEHGADAWDEDGKYDTALHAAFESGHNEIVELIIKHRRGGLESGRDSDSELLSDEDSV